MNDERQVAAVAPPRETELAELAESAEPAEPQQAGPPGRAAPPREVGAAVALLAVRTGLGLAAAVVQLGNATEVRAAISAANTPLTQAEVGSVYRGIVVIGVACALAYAGSYAALAVHTRRGRNWARNTARLLAGLGVLAGLSTLANSAPLVGRPLAVAIVGVDAAILVLLTRRPAARYFAARRPAEPPD